MSKELVELLTTDGIVGFLARQSGLPVTRVARIFRMGEPWPLIGQESCALGLRAVQLGTRQRPRPGLLAPIRMVVRQALGQRMPTVTVPAGLASFPESIPTLY